jgi:thiamine pyrophosphokinase
MSAWAEFLTAIASEDEVTLVGPLYHQRHIPLMPTVYVDGGSRFRAEDGGWAAEEPSHALFPTVSVGDGDSSPGTLDELQPSVKDYSDLAFVLRSLPASVCELTLLGFLGGRRDHELANFGEINDFLKSRTRPTRVDVVGNSGDLVIAFAHGSFNLEIIGKFSVFVFEPASVEIAGHCRYPLGPEVTLSPLSSHGLSNEGFGRVDFASAAPCFVLINSRAAV